MPTIEVNTKPQIPSGANSTMIFTIPVSTSLTPLNADLTPSPAIGLATMPNNIAQNKTPMKFPSQIAASGF